MPAAAVPGGRCSVTRPAEFAELGVPDDTVPEADAIVSIGHVRNYLPNEVAIEPLPT